MLAISSNEMHEIWKNSKKKKEMWYCLHISFSVSYLVCLFAIWINVDHAMLDIRKLRFDLIMQPLSHLMRFQ